VTWSIESVREAELSPSEVYRLYAEPATWGSWGSNTRWARADGPVVEGATVEVRAGYGRSWPVLMARMEPDRFVECVIRPPMLTVIPAIRARAHHGRRADPARDRGLRQGRGFHPPDPKGPLSTDARRGDQTTHRRGQVTTSDGLTDGGIARNTDRSPPRITVLSLDRRKGGDDARSRRRCAIGHGGLLMQARAPWEFGSRGWVARLS
jgi:hypothetical protein